MTSAKQIFRDLTSGPGLTETLCNFIIRPERAQYELDDLGPVMFRTSMASSERLRRVDLELENMRGMTLQCSWFKPCKSRRAPCIVYCHANCGSRCDSLEVLYLLDHGFTLFTFDCSGSGMSEGKYISLGCYERQDLAAVVEYLHTQRDSVSGIGLYGRSMGSVTSIMYAAKDADIQAIVCDSPFASLREIISDLVVNFSRSARYIPSFVINTIVERIRRKIAKLAAFDINDLDTIKYAAACTVPTLIIHGAADTFVRPKHSIAIMEAYRGPCIHQLIPGGHNDERDGQTEELVASFMQLYLVAKRSSSETGAAAAAAQTHSSAASKPPKPPKSPSVAVTHASGEAQDSAHFNHPVDAHGSSSGEAAGGGQSGAVNDTSLPMSSMPSLLTNSTLEHSAHHDVAVKTFYDTMKRMSVTNAHAAVLSVPLPRAEVTEQERVHVASAPTHTDAGAHETHDSHPHKDGEDGNEEDEDDRVDAKDENTRTLIDDRLDDMVMDRSDSIHAHAAMTTPQPLHLTKPNLRPVDSSSTTGHADDAACGG